jgi:hypothetical protein
MSTQLIGFSIGGVCKRFLVSPPSMIWPTNLVTAALFNTLHAQPTSGTKARGGISRERFFCYVFVGYIIYSQSFFFLALETGGPLGRGPALISLFVVPRLLSLVSLYGSFELLVGLLVGPSQSQDQPAVWHQPWFGHGRSHL